MSSGKGDVLATQSCLTLCDPTDCSPPSSSVLGIIQAGILDCHFLIQVLFPGDRTRVSCIGRQILYHEPPRKPNSQDQVQLYAKRHSDPDKVINVSQKQAHGEEIMGDMTPSKVIREIWGPLTCSSAIFACFLVVQNCFLSSCHHLLSPGSKMEKGGSVCPSLTRRLSGSLQDASASCHTQMPGRLRNVLFQLGNNGPN